MFKYELLDLRHKLAKQAAEYRKQKYGIKIPWSTMDYLDHSYLTGCYQASRKAWWTLFQEMV